QVMHGKSQPRLSFRLRSRCGRLFTPSCCNQHRIIRRRSDTRGACHCLSSPIGALGCWFACRPDLQFPRKAFWRTIAVLTPLGFLLDLLFGNAFFVFPNKLATLGWGVPALGGAIPIEEFIFYLAGFMLVLLSYIWCDEYWMAAYNVPDYAVAAKGIPQIVRFHFASVVVGILLIAAAILHCRFCSGEPSGFPWYFVYLV